MSEKWAKIKMATATAVSIVTLSACGGSTGVALEGSISMDKNQAALDEKIKKAYEGVYFWPGEFHLNPREMTTYANTWMSGDGAVPGSVMGCGKPYYVDPNALYVATWFYPCGTSLKITNNNPKNPNYGKSVVVKVADRGPNRRLSGAGWANNRVRGYGMDISAGGRAAVGQWAGDSGSLLVELISLPNGYVPNEAGLDLIGTSSLYNGPRGQLKSLSDFSWVVNQRIEAEMPKVKDVPKEITNDKVKPIQVSPRVETQNNPCWSNLLKKNFPNGYDNGNRQVCKNGKWVKY